MASSSADAPAAVESSGGLILALLTMLWAPTGTRHTRSLPEGLLCTCARFQAAVSLSAVFWKLFHSPSLPHDHLLFYAYPFGIIQFLSSGSQGAACHLDTRVRKGLVKKTI